MVTILIPVYRSAIVLHELHARLETVLQHLGEPFEIIFVEDCGGDDSWQVIEQIAAASHTVRGFRMSRNYGQHGALLCGIRAARGSLIITLDDDLQHPPECIPALVRTLTDSDEFDVVYGSAVRPTHGFTRNIASAVTKILLQRTMGAAAARHVSALRAFRTELRDAFGEYRSPYVNIDVLLTWATNRFTSIPVAHAPRHTGKSGYTLASLLRHALNMATGFSTAPLQIASVVGLGFACSGIIIFLYVAARWLVYGSVVPGFAFLASIIAVFSGAQLLALGTIGEYLARMYVRTMDRPAYVVRSQVESPMNRVKT